MEADEIKEEIANQRILQKEYQKYLTVLEQQAAKFGLYVPPHILVEINEIKEKMRQIQDNIDKSTNVMQAVLAISSLSSVTLEPRELTDKERREQDARAAEFNRHTRQGLERIIDTKAQQFLNEKTTAYCTHCRKHILVINKQVDKTNLYQPIYKGTCEICGSDITKISS